MIKPEFTQDNLGVALVYNRGITTYPVAPFSPDAEFVESPWHLSYRPLGPSKRSNQVYGMVREALYLLGMDRDRFDTSSWNPLSEVIEPGDNVIIKPNLVHHENPLGFGPESLVTNGSVVRAIADYAIKALGGKGTLIIGDGPIQLCTFDKVLNASGISELLKFYEDRGFPIELVDLRKAQSHSRNYRGWRGEPVSIPYHEAILVRLGEKSALCPLDICADRYRVTCYDPALTRLFHSDGAHDYLVSQRVLASDVVINVGKMKTHVRAGITGAMKNSLGIISDKTCLPHYRVGSPRDGGDEFEKNDIIKRSYGVFLDHRNRSQNILAKSAFGAAAISCRLLSKYLGGETIWEGCWPGNDTLWRTIHDVNRVLIYADKKGKIQEVPQRRAMSFIDGIVGGEGNGPLYPSPKPSGVILAGFNAASIDAVMATVMGFDFGRIATITKALDLRGVSNQKGAKRIPVISNRPDLIGDLDKQHRILSYVPSRNWDFLATGQPS